MKIWTGHNQQENKLQCIQESGDIVYVPDGWAHGMENLAETVGYVLEFDWARKPAAAKGKGKGKASEGKASTSGAEGKAKLKLKHVGER